MHQDPVTPAYVHATSFGPTWVSAYLHGLYQYKDLTNVHQKVNLVIKYLHRPIILLLHRCEDLAYHVSPTSTDIRMLLGLPKYWTRRPSQCSGPSC